MAQAIPQARLGYEGMLRGQDVSMAQIAEQRKARNQAGQSSMLGGLGSGLGTVAGFFMGGPPGAAVGGQLGSQMGGQAAGGGYQFGGVTPQQQQGMPALPAYQGENMMLQPNPYYQQPTQQYNWGSRQNG
jgi:hypothetical protein